MFENNSFLLKELAKNTEFLYFILKIFQSLLYQYYNEKNNRDDPFSIQTYKLQINNSIILTINRKNIRNKNNIIIIIRWNQKFSKHF